MGALLHAEDRHKQGDVCDPGREERANNKRDQDDYEPFQQVPLADEVNACFLCLFLSLFALEKFAEVPDLVETNGAEVVGHPEHRPADPVLYVGDEA